METAEQTIVRECQKGNLGKFSSLYDLYFKKIYNFIYFKTFHKETAEDLTSQTFFKSLENINKFDESKGTFSSWIYRIARNNVIDFYRQKKEDSGLDDAYGVWDSDDIEGKTEQKLQLAEVKKYLDKLAKNQKEIIIMRLWDQLSYEEISKITGNTEAACKMAFSRAIKKLREEMAYILLYLLFISNFIYIYGK